MKKKFYLTEVPEQMTVLQYIEARSDFSEVAERCRPKTKNQFFEYDCPVAPNILLDEFNALRAKRGLKGWRSHLGESRTYTGISLTYNPLHQDREDTFFSTLGSEKITNVESIGKGQGKYENLKNSYYDTYSFVCIHPEIRRLFDALISRCNLSMIRSRISQIEAGNTVSTAKDFGWHKDEFVCHNLRVNIPLLTSPEYFLESKGVDEQKTSSNFDLHLPVGKAYSWNTRVLHRAYAKAETPHPRVHMVLGFSPWFDFDPIEGFWIQNEYYGLHPFDMIEEGLIFRSRPKT